MAQSMGERMAKVETKLDIIDKKLTDFINTVDQKYASKLTEKIVYALCGVVLLGFLGVVLKLGGLY